LQSFVISNLSYGQIISEIMQYMLVIVQNAIKICGISPDLLNSVSAIMTVI